MSSGVAVRRSQYRPECWLIATPRRKRWATRGSDAKRRRGPVEGGVCTDQIKMTVVRPDITFTDLPEAKEVNTGGFLPLNNDDDDNNGQPDLQQTESLGHPVANEGDLRYVTLWVYPYERLATVELTTDPGNTKIAVYEEDEDENGHVSLVPIPSGSHTWGPGTFSNPTWLRVEGIAASTAPRDITMTLRYKPPGGRVFEDQIKLTVVAVDLDVDANRDGAVTDADDSQENTWAAGPGSRGAIMLPNADKDNTAYGAPDNWVGGDWDLDGIEQADEHANTLVDADPDKDDLAPLWVRGFGWDPLPENMTVTLSVAAVPGENAFFGSVPAENRLRVFLPSGVAGADRVIQAGDRSVIGPEAGADVEFVATPGSGQEDLSLFATSGTIKLGMEGIEFGAPVDITLTVGLNGTELATDKVRVRVAPFALADHTVNVNTGASRPTVHVENLYGDNTELRTVLRNRFGSTHVAEASTADPWHQDGYEIGYAKAPYGAMPVVLDLPRGARSANALYKYTHNALLRSGVAVCTGIRKRIFNNDQDDGGNLESRPGSNAPGSFFHGDDMSAEVVGFFGAQSVNTNMPVDTSWLLVGHVDELISFAPDGTHTVVADPEVCWALLVWADAVDPAAPMLQGMLYPSGIAVHDVLSPTRRACNLEWVMDSGRLSAIRNALTLPSPESTPVRSAGTGTGSLTRGGAFIGFFPNDNVREYRLTFTTSADYDLEFRESGGAWTPSGGGRIDEDEVFPDALCFVLRHWWSGTFAAGDSFAFAADPTCPTVEMPVLFRLEVDLYSGQDKAVAYTNNHVNSLVDGNTVITADAHGPVVQYRPGHTGDILGDYIQTVFQRAGYATVTRADELIYHNNEGSIHCATNAERVLPAYNWWEH